MGECHCETGRFEGVGNCSYQYRIVPVVGILKLLTKDNRNRGRIILKEVNLSYETVLFPPPLSQPGSPTWRWCSRPGVKLCGQL